MNITLSGVIVGLLTALLPILLKLRHESIEKEKQRVFDTRINIYLKAIENFTLAEQYFLNLSFQGEIINDELSPNPFIASSRKINLVGNNETVSRVNKVAEAFSRALVGLSPLMKKSLEIQGRIDTLQLVIGELKPKHDHYHAEHDNATLQSQPDFHLVEKLDQRFKFVSAQYNQLLEEQKECRTAKKEILIAMKKFGAEQVMEMAVLMPPALCSIRKELGLEFDEDTYLKEVEENRAKAEKIIKNI